MGLKPEAFRLMRDSDLCPEARAGTTVYSCILGTYGLAAQDTRMTGRRHRCVTLDPEGGYPFFTVPDANPHFSHGYRRLHLARKSDAG